LLHAAGETEHVLPKTDNKNGRKHQEGGLAPAQNWTAADAPPIILLAWR
jgi:hypothetical protein